MSELENDSEYIAESKAFDKLCPKGSAESLTASLTLADCCGSTMTAAQRTAIAETVQILLERFHLTADNVTYHAWWTAKGQPLGDYIKGKSAKTCPGTAFFGGNTRAAYEKKLRPMIEAKGEICLQKVESINDIVWELANAGIITDSKLWMQKCAEDKNVYWLCCKMANKLRGRL